MGASGAPKAGLPPYGMFLALCLATLLGHAFKYVFGSLPGEKRSPQEETPAEALSSKELTAEEKEVLGRLRLGEAVVLRLGRAASRSAELEQDAAEIRLPLRFMDATDGFQKSWRVQVMPLLLPNGTCADVVGAIFNSHEHAWGLAASGDLPILVMEDDVRLPPDFVDELELRMKELPKDFHLALAGTSVTRRTTQISATLSRPDASDSKEQGMLGLWSYVVSPAGARELLRQVLALRQNGKVRTFQQVDMFIAHRLDQLKVYVLEPSSELAREFEVRPDVRHVLSHMRQTGIVRLKDTPSLNSPLQNQETTDMIKMRDDITQLIESGQHQEAWDMSRKALKTMRRFSCWETSSLLQKAGIALLKLLADNEQGAPKLGGPERTLLTALEALAMARLFVEGTWLDQVKQSDYKKLVRLEINRRKSNGLTVVEPTGGWENRTPLPGGGWLEATMPPNLKVAL